MCVVLMGCSTGRHVSPEDHLSIAIGANNYGTVSELIPTVDVDSLPRIGVTQLDSALLWADARIVRLVLGAGADPNLQSTRRKVPVIIVAAARATEDRRELVQLLLDAGADPCATATPDGIVGLSKNEAIERQLLSLGTFRAVDAARANDDVVLTTQLEELCPVGPE